MSFHPDVLIDPRSLSRHTDFRDSLGRVHTHEDIAALVRAFNDTLKAIAAQAEEHMVDGKCKPLNDKTMVLF